MAIPKAKRICDRTKKRRNREAIAQPRPKQTALAKVYQHIFGSMNQMTTLERLARAICHAVEQRSDDCNMEIHARILDVLIANEKENQVREHDQQQERKTE